LKTGSKRSLPAHFIEATIAFAAIACPRSQTVLLSENRENDNLCGAAR
jgi:hypothetical protein